MYKRQIICNPPYGKKLGDENELIRLYEQMGIFLKNNFSGWEFWLLSGNPILTKYNNWNIEYNLLLIIFIDLFLAGLSLKLGGKLAKGPYLPQTLEGLGKTTKAVLGKK